MKAHADVQGEVKAAVTSMVDSIVRADRNAGKAAATGRRLAREVLAAERKALRDKKRCATTRP